MTVISRKFCLMREQRWESQVPLSFSEILSIGQRLASQGLNPATPDKEGICYIEEWEVTSPEGFQQLDPWPTEDITMLHILEGWQGDFFLLTGRYHSVFQRYQSVNTYCSLCHPWHVPGHLATLDSLAMLWVGFRHTHSFIRVRLHTTEVVTPGETWADHQRLIWLDERHQAFQSAIDLLELPIESVREKNMVYLRTNHQETPFFCSWPDAFGPCQFEFNSSNPFEFLVPASRLAATHRGTPSNIRIYLTGFSKEELKDFEPIEPKARYVYRCSMHCSLNELPEILSLMGQSGRLYTTMCELQTHSLLPNRPDAAAIIGIVGTKGHFQIEVRLNLMPLARSDMDQWLEQLLGIPMTYAPLLPFP